MAKIEDFSSYEDDNNEEEYEEKGNKKKIISLVAIICLAVILGLLIFFITNAIVNRSKKEEPFIGEQVDLNDENISILYQYVTYGTKGTRNQKYVTERNVNLSSFTDEEKLYYAFQFVQVEDFVFTNEYTDDKSKIYNISKSKIDEYMRLYFGPNVTYNPVGKITYPFTFQINRKNIGSLTYNSERSGYDAVFRSYQDITKKINVVDPVYGELISALRTPTGEIILQERVVYTNVENNGNLYTVKLYKDPERTILLDTKSNLSINDASNLVINFNDYESTAIVEYTFGLDGNTLYFKESKIII